MQTIVTFTRMELQQIDRIGGCEKQGRCMVSCSEHNVIIQISSSVSAASYVVGELDAHKLSKYLEI